MKNALTMYSGVSEGGGSVKVGDMQVLWRDQVWMCIKERSWKVQLGLWVRCGSSSYVQTYTPTEDLATDCRR